MLCVQEGVPLGGIVLTEDKAVGSALGLSVKSSGQSDGNNVSFLEGASMEKKLPLNWADRQVCNAAVINLRVVTPWRRGERPSQSGHLRRSEYQIFTL